MELPDDIGAGVAGGGQDPKEIPTRRWSERVSEASRILPKHRGASVSAAWPPGELLIDYEEDRTLRAGLVGMLREPYRGRWALREPAPHGEPAV